MQSEKKRVTSLHSLTANDAPSDPFRSAMAATRRRRKIIRAVSSSHIHSLVLEAAGRQTEGHEGGEGAVIMGQLTSDLTR